MNKIIIGLAGKIASGKGTAAKFFKEEYGAEVFVFSQPLRDILQRMHCEINRPNMQNLSTTIRKQFGEDLLAKIMAEDVKSSAGKIIVVDGVRRMSDIEYLKENPNFILTSIDAEAKTRYERLTKRSQNNDDAQKTYEQFLIDEEGESEKEIPIVCEYAQEKINNNGSQEELESQLKNIIKKYAE
jgi:dephospho-CoA kinase